MNNEYVKLYLESKLEITFFEFVLLVLIYQNEEGVLKNCYDEDFMMFSQMIRKLESYGYVKWHGSDIKEISLRKRGEDLFARLSKRRKKPIPDVELWIDDWRKIFPEGTNTGGYRYRGNKLEVLKKMLKFVATYEYSKEEIFEATRRYVERFAVRGYTYMQQAHYFIEKKDAGSNLASECETLREKPNEEKIRIYGGTIS